MIRLKENIKNNNYTYSNNNLLINSDVAKDIYLELDNKLKNEFNIDVKENITSKIIIEIKNSINLINVNLGANSNLNLTIINESLNNIKVSNYNYKIEKDSNLSLFQVFISNKIEVNNNVNLLGIGSSTSINEIILSGSNDYQHINTYINHFAKNSYANLNKVGVATNGGKVIINGIAKINKGFSGSNTFQTLKGIITTNNSHLEANPILLIDEYDVKAGHAATIGKVEDEALFYLMSRGLEKKEAEKLIIKGNINLITNNLDENLKNKIDDLVEVKL